MALVYAGIGSRKTPPQTLQDMTTIAGWLAPQGWHLASGGAFGADTAFALGAPVAQRTIYLPEHGFNRLSGPDCLVPDPSDMEACIALAARLHPAWHKCSPFARRAHGRNAAILLGPQLDTPVNTVVAWSPGGRPEGGTGMALRIAGEHGIEVMNLATMAPRAVCERLLDIRRGLSADAPRPDAPAPRNAPDERTYAAADVAAFRFTRAQYGELSNFAPLSRPIAAGPWTFPTTEHLYQAAKFTAHPEVQARIAAAPTARDAARIGRSRDLPVDPDWNERRVDVMRWIIRLKHAANPALIGAQLADTADRPIVEHSARDGFWGAQLVGVEYRGSNVLGRLWMELRQQIRDNDPAASPDHWTQRARVGRLAEPSRSEEIRVGRTPPAAPSDPAPQEPSYALERPHPGVGRNEHIDPGLLSPHPDTESRLQPLHGPAPDPDATRIESHHYRVDVRDAWDPHDAGAAVRAAYAALSDICPDGTPLASERQALAYGFVHALKSNAMRLWGRVDQQRYELDQAREVDRHLHDSLASETETLRASLADERVYTNYRHSKRGLEDHSRRARRRDPDAVAGRGIARPGANPASPGVARSARDMGASLSDSDPDDIPDIAAGHNNLERRAHALDEIAGIAAQCYRADFGEDWIAPRDPTAFTKPRSQDPSWVREQREKGDPRVRLASWLTQWQILNQRAKNRNVPIAEMPAYANMVGKAHDIAERDDADKLSPYETKWLGEFLKLHPRVMPAPGAPDRSPGPTGPSPRSPWDRDRAIAALHTLVDTLDRRVLANGTQLDDERRDVLSSLGQWLYRERNRVEANVRRIEGRGGDVPESLRSSLAALTDLGNEMSEIHFRRTSTEWTPAKPPARERAKSIAAAELDARKIVDRHDYASARSKLVGGTYIAVSGSKHWTDAGAIHRVLDAQRAQHPDMVLMHGGGPGAATIARSWASDRGVDQVIYLPQTNRYGRKAAPLRRNEEMLNDKPQLIVSFDCPGNPEPIAAEAAKRSIAVERFVDPALPARDLAAGVPDRSHRSPTPVPPAAASPPAPRTDPRAAPEPEHMPPSGHQIRPSAACAAPSLGPVPGPQPPATTVSTPALDLTGQDALATRIEEHEKAQPPRTHAVVDGVLRHYEERPEYIAWVERARELLAAVPGFDTDSADNLTDAIQDAAYSLHADLPHADEPRDFIQELHDDVFSRHAEIERETEDGHALSWIYDDRTNDLLQRAEALAQRLSAEPRTDITNRMTEDLADLRSTYDLAMEHREDLDRINARLEKHLEDRQQIREKAAQARDATANHPDYDRWEKRLNDLKDSVSQILYETDAYALHLADRPALASEIRSNLDLLTTAHEGDLRLARTLASPSPAPQHDPAIAEAPTLEPAPDRYPEPPPEPRHEPVPQPEDEGLSPSF